MRPRYLTVKHGSRLINVPERVIGLILIVEKNTVPPPERSYVRMIRVMTDEARTPSVLMYNSIDKNIHFCDFTLIAKS